VIPASHSCKIVVLNDRENFFSMLGYEKADRAPDVVSLAA